MISWLRSFLPLPRHLAAFSAGLLAAVCVAVRVAMEVSAGSAWVSQAPRPLLLSLASVLCGVHGGYLAASLHALRDIGRQAGKRNVPGPREVA